MALLFSVSAHSAQLSCSGEGILACYTACVMFGFSRAAHARAKYLDAALLSLAAANTIGPPACPSAHCYCGGVWARRVDGPCANPWGHTTPCRLASHGRLRLRWAPCRKLNWEMDALAAAFAPLVVRLRVVVAHINCVSYITLVEWRVLLQLAHLLHNKSTFGFIIS